MHSVFLDSIIDVRRKIQNKRDGLKKDEEKHPNAYHQYERARTVSTRSIGHALKRFKKH